MGRRIIKLSVRVRGEDMETRYDRQVLLDEVGQEGQEKLKNAKVLVIGAGGLGCPVLTYLACAGVGYIRVIEEDIISISNLNRQFLYHLDQTGQKKAETVKEHLLSVHPEIKVDAVSERITAENAEKFLDGIDLVVDCVDNAHTRLVMNDICLKKKIPLVEGGVEGFYGFVTVVTEKTACLRCMGIEDVPKDRVIPVLGTTAGVIGTLEANECIKLILGLDSTLKGAMLQYDGYQGTIKRIPVRKDPKCKLH